MTFEPINIFAHRVDVAGVLNTARSHAQSVRVTGPEDAWSRLEVVVEKRWLRPDRVLVITQDPGYYAGEGWPRQLQGMQNYFRRFEGDYGRVGFTRTDVMRLIGGFRFSLAFPEGDLDIHGEDPRLEVIFAITEALEGAIFTPSGLRDARGRVLMGESGPDPQAQLPAAAMLPNVVSVSGHQDVQASDVVAGSYGAQGDHGATAAEAGSVDVTGDGREESTDPRGRRVVPDAGAPSSGNDAGETPTGSEAHAASGADNTHRTGERDDSEEQADGDGGDEFVPPTSQRAARRLIALAAVSGRAFLELNGGDEEDRQALLAWLGTVDLGDELEDWEIEVLAQPVGALSERTCINAMWRIEGLAVLAWAFELHELNADDQISDPKTLFDDVGVLAPEAAQWLVTQGQLRPIEQRHAAAAHYVMLHWRLREFSLSGVPMNFVKFSEDCWFGSFDVNQYELAGDDLAIDGEPIAWAPAESVNRATSITMERHLAANWLCGAAEIYSETDTST